MKGGCLEMNQTELQLGKIKRERLSWLIRLLKQNHHPSRLQLAESMEVTVRTVQRDLNFLRDRLGAPIEYDKGRGGYRLSEPAWFLPQVSLTEGELFSLLIARQAVAQYRGTPVEKTLEQVFDKIAGQLSEHISVDHSGWGEGLLSFAPGPVLPVKEEVWNRILNAARERQTVKIKYHSLRSGRVNERQVDPHHILNIQGDWYLFARDHTHQEIRQFQLHRIESVTQLHQPFLRDPDFDPARFLQHHFAGFGDSNKQVELHLEIRGHMARLLQDRIFHPQQHIQSIPDGFEIRFPVSAAGKRPFYNVLQWILSMGRDARILAPPALQERYLQEVEFMHPAKKNRNFFSE